MLIARVRLLYLIEQNKTFGSDIYTENINIKNFKPTMNISNFDVGTRTKRIN